MIRAGFALTGTWPMRTELGNRMIGSGTNALASSIILVCRRRPDDAATDLAQGVPARAQGRAVRGAGGDARRRRRHLADRAGGLAQAAIGPGMAVFSKYAAVLEANGEPMSVHTALTLINKQVDEVLGGEHFDADTNFCLGWFQEVGWSAGAFGEANTLAQAKGTSVDGAASAGVVQPRAARCGCTSPQTMPPTGTRARTIAPPSGKPCTSWSVP